MPYGDRCFLGPTFSVSRYLCSRCDSLQNAERFTEFTQLPPVLHISLLRFVYDLNTMERKKSKQSISFPKMLDMDQFVKSKQKGSPGTSNKYHLRGVLLHKGSSAYHGHYEAQVFDIACVELNIIVSTQSDSLLRIYSTQSWYQFNDEVVFEIEALFPDPKTESQPSQNGSQSSGKCVPMPVSRSGPSEYSQGRQIATQNQDCHDEKEEWQD